MSAHTQEKVQSNALALLPLLVFLIIFLGSGIYHSIIGTEFAFYQIKAPIAAIPAIILALLLYKQKLNTAIEEFLQGASHPNLILMFMVFMLAGAFASVSGAIGSVDATVQLGLSLISAQFVLPMLFIIAAFIATAMGTSMGTIAACAPIAFGFSQATDITPLYAIGAVIGGAMFGDNLSMISDTTIAATRSQNVELRDKFKVNVWIALPAAIITLIVYFSLSHQSEAIQTKPYDIWLILPYLAVFFLAFTRLHVLAVLMIGVVLSGMMGLLNKPDFHLLQLNNSIYNGFVGMFEVALLSMLLGGLSALMQKAGGLHWLIQRIYAITRLFKFGTQRAGEFGISFLVVFSNLFVANNTVAIILSGDMARVVAKEYGIDPKRSAALLDIFSCVTQGIIPYGAQLLLACSIAKISPIELIGHIYYCWVLAIFAILAIVFHYPRLKTS
ncbi:MULTISPECIES: Na+/H+ antiporter NhaC family protein [Acinetobacter]|nr:MULTISPECIES: Na+/H+ antiporter NhaC family protein [Acinetobacter]APR69474.1 sodium:proton antiporter [Acinetobacter haemolyticus]ATZ68097.1 sodium:proton antiporter [Acinetobacter haemolyticus]EEH67244.1 Na+/H+ antiporter family protein [Acinetobacter sp. ATCC 27244]NAR29441.1 Na+/H+ antiporter NhaC family protein [Acinetobacter haemolyticus]NAR48097.1 Na+/H+ antiporter NhaC family protein [Acinetobacter haemolyticus]